MLTITLTSPTTTVNGRNKLKYTSIYAHTHTHAQKIYRVNQEKLDRWVKRIIFSLVSAFSQKNKTYKMGLRVCVCVVCVCLYVCVSVYSFCPPPNNFHTSYAIDAKFWLHIVSYRNSPTSLIPFLNFKNCAREQFLKFIFLPFN